MKQLDKTITTSNETLPPKPYHQQPGETDLWYSRFYHFCSMGPSRTLLQCYREIMAERHADAASSTTGDSLPDHLGGGASNGHRPERDEGQPPERVEGTLALQTRKVSGGWLKKAKDFDWVARAAAWDIDRRQMAVKRVEETLNLITEAAREALQFHIDLMNGYIKDHSGKMIPVHDIYQRRMAAKSILNKAVEVSTLLQQDQAQKRQRIKVTEIRVHEPGSERS